MNRGSTLCRWRYALITAITALLTPITGSASDEIRLTAEQASASGIETANLQPDTGGASVGFPAQVVVPPHQLQIVSAPLAGLLDQVLVGLQQPVRKGELVGRLQSPELADLQHTFLQAATQVALAKANLERDAALYKAGVIARSRLQATRAHLDEVNVDLAERGQALRLAGMSDKSIAVLRGGRSVGSSIALVAPIDGVVLELLASAGQRLDPAQAVMKIARLDPLWLEIAVPSAKLGAISEGMAVRVKDSPATGKVTNIGRALNPANQTVVVRVEISQGGDQLRAGEFVEASFGAAPIGRAWVVPNGALARVGARVVVFTKHATGFRVQTVQVLREGEQSSVIGGEFGDSDQVAVKGLVSLKAMLTGDGAR